MAILRFGPYELDDARADLRRDGAPVEIQALPLRLLCYLARQPGQVISRDELLQQVWDGTTVSDNAIATALKHVRQSLGDRDRDPPWVETLRGRGVRFTAPVETIASEGDEVTVASRSRPRRARRWLALVAATAASGVLIALALFLSWPAPLGLLLDLAAPTGRPGELSLPNRPSIVVLPFTNMSGDPEQEYFSDGLTEELTTDLARNPSLFVISRHSAFIYKGRAFDVREVGRELGVAYAIEGSVRQTDGRVRITAQLIDTRTGGHVWTASYDRDLADVLALQSEVSREIQTTLRSQIQGLQGSEARRRWRRGTDDPRAYDEFLRADALILSMRRRNITVLARRHLERAIEIDPNYSTALARLAATYWMEFGVGWSRDRGLLDRAEALARRAIELAPDSGDGYEPLSSILILRGRLDEALEAADRAAAANPNLAVAHLVRVPALAFSGRYYEAFQTLQSVRRLDPHSTVTTVPYAWANLLAGRVDRAAELFERARTDYPDLVIPRLNLAAYYESRDRHPEAAMVVDEILAVVPEFTAAWGERFVDPQICGDRRATLARAGLPDPPAESPPLRPASAARQRTTTSQ